MEVNGQFPVQAMLSLGNWHLSQSGHSGGGEIYLAHAGVEPQII